MALFALTHTLALGIVAALLTQSALADDISFNRDIAPILAANCYECHGPDEEQLKAGLRLDKQDIATAQLNSGATAISPGSSEKSELISRVLAEDDERMPPADFGDRLSAKEISLLRRWIDRGAVWQGHWAFEPLDGSPVPTNDTIWSSNPIDQFIHARLENVGLMPADSVDRYILIRRIYFDLVGLPPEPDVIHHFVTDNRPDAYQRLVDSLLALPGYGERWGRHWLDVARYGDSNGGDENHAYPLAHRYRDYVIEVFNDDLTYDRFIRQQLAGDLLDKTDDERLSSQRLTATGYLAIGMKILAEQDQVKKQADMIDEQIDTFGRTFLGLSLGCARCHDHKFDPIPTKDYYALAGIFHSSAVGDNPLPSRDYDMRLVQHNTRVAKAKDEVDQIQRSLAETCGSAAAITREAESFERGNVVIDKENYGKEIGIISDPGGQLNFAEYDLEIGDPGEYVIQLRYAAGQERPGRLLINGEVAKQDAIAEATGGWMPEHQTWQTEGIFKLRQGKNTVRVESEPMMSHIDKVRIVARELVDGKALERFDELSKQLAAFEQEKPKPTLVMAMTDGNAMNTKVHVRGSHLSLGEEVPRSFLEVLDGKSSFIPDDRSGRLQLANWLTQNEAAATLTSRVIVNRVWQWHFGRGLVATPDDFGIRGTPATHPKLLDFLALHLIENDWSLKSLHRMIVCSKTYQMDSDVRNPDAIKIDPSNKLYWKRNRTRLDAESIRDALLLHSGQLASQLGDSPMFVKSQDPSPEDMANNLKKYESSQRRSVYLPVVRSNVYEFFTLFGS